ncbi:MAG: beta-mannosidase [Thermoanaerobacterium sp.]|nr:beta-mannosidase [Thermoanaerobacterium sp.]
MVSLSLNGIWKVDYISCDSSIVKILSNDFVPEGWIDAFVPEDIHTTLKRMGIIKGHYFGKNVKQEQWIEENDWVYYKEFYVKGDFRKDKVYLKFDGLDTFCDIYLNGVKIGHCENMFVSFSFDVTDKLCYGQRNVLIIRFYSPVKYVNNKNTYGLFSTTSYDRLFARKAQMNYSWDFCGRCVSLGIWKSVYLEAYDHNYINNYYIYTKKIDNNDAQLGLEVDLNEKIEALDNYSLSVKILKDGKKIYEYTGNYDDFKKLQIDIKNAQLWWPRPYGKPNLYDFQLDLLKEGAAVDSKRQKFGIRVVEIIQESQNDGISFIFQVNGKRLFVRGANWVPINVVYTEITDEEYERYISYAVEGNISMLRVWGGGIYESDKFFELCDREGIMVFNDFMLACGVYPQDEEFLSNVYKEAVYNILRLRNYTSLVLWSGNNENDEAYGWSMMTYSFFNDKISRDVIKMAVENYDPHRYYLPSSPCSPFVDAKGGDNPNSPYQGDMHIYITSMDPKSVMYYKKIKTFKPRFMSEFGFICLPEKDTFYKFNFLKKELDIEHILSSVPEADKCIKSGSDFDEMIYRTQLYCSYALKYWIEYFRTLKWTCSGCLYWKFNDPIADNNDGMLYPTLMSTVDFCKMPKMSYYYTKRAFEDLILVCDEVKDGYNIYSCSELDYDIEGQLRILHLDFMGNVIDREVINCLISKDSAKKLHELRFNTLSIRDKYNEYIKIIFESTKFVVENRYFFVDIYEFYKLKFKQANLDILDIHVKGDEIYITLKTDIYARNIRLNILDVDVIYEDNYFDMDAMTEKTLKLKIKNIDYNKLLSKLLYIDGENIKRVTYNLSKLF